MEAEVIPCPHCGGLINSGATKCKHCKEFIQTDGAPQQSSQTFPNQTIVINQQQVGRPRGSPLIALPENRNNAGTAGFVLSLLALIFSWTPFVNLVLWLLGLIFSLVGLSKKPKGLAVAGLIISLISILVIILLIGAIGAIIALFTS